MPSLNRERDGNDHRRRKNPRSPAGWTPIPRCTSPRPSIPVGGLLGTREFPATAAGYASLLGWLGKFGDVALVGVEGTGSYGAGLARYLAAHGVRVVEVDRADRQDRHRNGKSDPLDAVSAARAALSGRASGAARRAATGRWRRSGR